MDESRMWAHSAYTEKFGRAAENEKATGKRCLSKCESYPFLWVVIDRYLFLFLILSPFCILFRSFSRCSIAERDGNACACACAYHTILSYHDVLKTLFWAQHKNHHDVLLNSCCNVVKNTPCINACCDVWERQECVTQMLIGLANVWLSIGVYGC